MLESAVARARVDGVELLRVIHGWGSSGTGGRLGMACRRQCERWVREHAIARYCPGESYGMGRVVTREWVGRYPELKRHIATDTDNYGITFVELPSRKRRKSDERTQNPEPRTQKWMPLAVIVEEECDSGDSPRAPSIRPALKKGNPKPPRTTPPKARATFRKTVKHFEEL
ncbi:MAG: Smr/MutS family protein [Kiritimatiellaeota bacterium]|nr:Smr/MutS family protein [Kiritimatiellota bacterium]